MIRKPNRGQALALTAVSLVALVGFAGLAVDMGVLRYEKHLQQIAADSAALAGANELADGASNLPAAAITAGMNASAQNGFADNQVSSGTNGNISTCTGYAKDAPVSSSTVLPVCVEINNPPLTPSDPHYNDKNYVEAYVAADHPTFFMKIFGITNRPVVARAVATLDSDTGESPGCVYTLGSATKSHGIGVTANGTPYVKAPTCGFFDNGDWTTNGATVNIQAGSVDVAGPGVNNNGGGTVTCSSEPNNCPDTSSGPIKDPLASLQNTPPTPGTPVAFNQSNPVPGTYSSIDISGGNVTFQPGMYYVDGNMTINGNANVTNAKTGVGGVEFYIYGSGAVTIDGTGNVVLNAPTSSPYGTNPPAPPGTLFYQDPTDTSAAKIVGTSGSSFTGELYFPTATLTFGGTSSNTSTFNSGASYTIIVANNLDFNGTAQIILNTDYSALPGGQSPIQNAILVE